MTNAVELKPRLLPLAGEIKMWHFSSDLPPSVNHLYTVFHGRKILSKEGKAFKNNFQLNRGNIPVYELSHFPNKESLYGLSLQFIFPPYAVFTKGYETGKAAGRFKKLDISNYVKVLEDSICSLLNMDDCQFFEVLLQKKVDPQSITSKVIGRIYDLSEKSIFADT